MWPRRSARLRGEPAEAFRFRDYGNLATIGRKAAVVEPPGGISFSGRLAWWFWLAAHVFFLIGFRNRMIVLINRASAYIGHRRHARTILGDAEAGAPAGTGSLPLKKGE